MFRIKTALLACLLLVAVLSSVANAKSQELGDFSEFVSNTHLSGPPPPAPPMSFLFVNSALKEACLALSAQAKKVTNKSGALAALNRLKTSFLSNAKGIQQVLQNRTDGLSLDINEWNNRINNAIVKAKAGSFQAAADELTPLKSTVFQVLGMSNNAW